MKAKIALICCALLIIVGAAYARMTVIGVTGVVSGAPGGSEPCDSETYTFSSGDNESFEAGTGDFCTAGWTLGNADSFDATWAHCGSTSLAIYSDSDDGTTITPYIDLGSLYTDSYFRIYIKTPSDLPDYTTDLTIIFAKYSSGGTAPAVATFRDDSNGGTAMKVFLTAGEYFNFTEGDEIRLEVRPVANGTSQMKLWRKNGASWDAVETNNGGGDYIAESSNAFPDGVRYILISEGEGTTTGFTWYFDDAEFSSAGWLGEYTCQ